MVGRVAPVIVAIIAAYNEADVIGQVVKALIDQGVLVYFLDHHSTDGTVAEVERFRGDGVIGIETFQATPAASALVGTFALERILARKEELSRSLDADWFIHHDADEFRESPWSGVTLSDAISRVDAAGYNAIDFKVLNFRPTSADPRADDIRTRLQFYEEAGSFDRLQIKCWKKTNEPVVLLTTGGHSAEFANRRVFPIRFLLRHYPIRSQAHGLRKIFQERLPRFADAERDRGWHVQYDGLDPNASFVSDPATLVRYDPEGVRLDLFLRHRGVEGLEQELAACRQDSDRLTQSVLELARLRTEQDRLASERDRLVTERDQLATARERLDRGLRVQNAAAARLQAERDGLSADLEAARLQLSDRDTQLDELRSGVLALRTSLGVEQGRLAAKEDTISSILASRSWRLTTPLRRVERRLFSRSTETIGPSSALANLPAGRALRLDSDVTGFWGDGWAGRELTCRLRATRRIAELALVGVVPAELGDGQDFTVAVGGQTWTFHAAPGRFRWGAPVTIAPDGIIQLVVVAARTWQPHATGRSVDIRELAWRVERIGGS